MDKQHAKQKCGKYRISIFIRKQSQGFPSGIVRGQGNAAESDEQNAVQIPLKHAVQIQFLFIH
jgi:hypothetical protein